MPFQTTINIQQAPAVTGDFATLNLIGHLVKQVMLQVLVVYLSGGFVGYNPMVDQF
jgi:hypothetical protein